MLMRGDLNKIIEQVNVVTEKMAKRLEVLEKEVKDLKEAPKAPQKEKSTPKAA